MNKKEVKAWIEEHKGLLIGIGVGTVCVAGTIIGVKCIPKKLSGTADIEGAKLLASLSESCGKFDNKNARIIDEQVFTVLAPQIEDALIFGSGGTKITQDYMLDNGIRKLVEVTVKES